MKKYLFLSLFLLVFSQFLYSLRGILVSTPIDFLHYYLSSKALWLGQNPYNYVSQFKLGGGESIVFNYPPTALLFFWPLAIFPVEITRGLWEVFILICLIFTVVLILKILNIKKTPSLFFIIYSLLFLSFPIRHTFGMGQVSIIIGFLLLLSYYSSLTDRHSGERSDSRIITKNDSGQTRMMLLNHIYSGLFLSLAISLKTFPLIFLLYYLLKRKFKIVLYTFLFLIAEIFISYILVGSFGWNKYLSISPKPDIFLMRGHYYEQSLSAFFSRLPAEFNLKLILFIIAESSLFLLTVYLNIKSKNKNRDDLLYSLYFILAVIALGFNWQNYFALLIFPFIVIAKNINNFKNLIKPVNIQKRSKVNIVRVTTRTSHFVRRIYYGYIAYILMIILIISYLLLSVNIKNPDLLIKSYGLPGIFILSHQLYGALILFFINIWLLLHPKS